MIKKLMASLMVSLGVLVAHHPDHVHFVIKRSA